VSAASSAASSGAVLGIVIVFLVQQFGWVPLTSIVTSVIYFAVAAIVGGVVFGLAARAARRRGAKPVA